SGSAPISAARRPTVPRSPPRISVPIGWVASSARAINRSSILPAACTRAFPRRRTFLFRLTNLPATPASSSAKTARSRCKDRIHAKIPDLDRRPLSTQQALERAVGQVRCAEELQFLVLLRLARRLRPGAADRHGYF